MSWQILEGDCLDVLRTLPPASVQCVVTSPPYWGLRDYGTASWEGGDGECDHTQRLARADAGRVSTDDRPGNINPAPVETPIGFRDTCGKCGARRIDSQLGLEPTPEGYVENLVAVFREVRRVLRDDGTVWLNLGDSYASQGGGGRDGGSTGQAQSVAAGATMNGARTAPDGLKPKDLVGIPWRVAFALQADGWYLRSDIIWAKPNPMPESVTDRPTKAHEYVFLLSKSARYYFDADAVREPAQDWGSRDRLGPLYDGTAYPDRANGHTGLRNMDYAASGRNIRSVWNIATEPFPGAHFATFPKKLVEPCIKAGTSERGCCGTCGAPWVRVADREREWLSGSGGPSLANGHGPDGRTDARASLRITTTGWARACDHDDESIPCTVLDPFAGSGTVGVVAARLGRSFIGVELNPAYAEMARDRIRDDGPLFNVGAEVVPIQTDP